MILTEIWLSELFDLFLKIEQIKLLSLIQVIKIGQLPLICLMKFLLNIDLLLLQGLSVFSKKYFEIRGDQDLNIFSEI